MTEQLIPAEAVEAAAKGIYRHLMPPPSPIWAELNDPARAKYHAIARHALDAAAPRMLAMAWGDGFNGGISGSWPEDNPYQSES